MGRIPYKWKRFLVLWKDRLLKKWHDLNLDFKNVEVELYDLNKKVEPYIHAINIILVFMAVASLVISVGFALSDFWQQINTYLEIILLGLFSLTYLVRVILTSQRFAFICTRYLESFIFILSLVLIISLIGSDDQQQLLFNEHDGILSIDAILLNAVKIGLFFFILAKFIRVIPVILSARQHPGKILAGSFLTLILMGAGLLMLPVTTVDGIGLAFIDALFTATSAVCVTGLIVVDTATHFTITGQIIIMILIQLGGIGIVTFATFFVLFSNSGMGMGQMAYLRDIVQESNVTQTINTLKKIVGLTFTIELLGAIGYYYTWRDAFPVWDERLLFSVFHAISAFCNAGFALFTNSLADTHNAMSVSINIITVLLIILGGLGFTTIWELGRGINRKNRRLSLHAQLVLWSTAILVLVGFIGIIGIEWDKSLRDYSFGYKALMAFFQSVTTRTAGFNTIDISALGFGTTMIIMILMAIGASPASTGGGLKTTTFSVLLLTVVAVLRGDTKVEVAHKTIPFDIILKAFTSLFIAGMCIMTGTTILAITENQPFLDLLFEEISAFSTVGLSRGVTSSLTNTGKIVIIVSMFLGRVGSLTLLAAFISKQKKRNYIYPRESVMVS